MWELIKENQRKSILIFACLAVCLLLLGYFIGAIVDPVRGGAAGLAIALGIWTIMSIVAVFGGESILISSSHAKEVSYDMYPQLFNVAEEMKIAAGLPAMPKLYIMHHSTPNAFATGFDVKSSAIVVTTGLLERLNRDELQGVVAHEMGHIVNRDVQFMTLAGVLLGTITLISQVFLRSMIYMPSGRSRRYSSRGSGGGQAQIVMIIVAIVIAILAPILAQIFYFAISRKREYLADATAVRLTRYPEGLASALEKISSDMPLSEADYANKITAPMYIVNPLQPAEMKANSLGATHPPIKDRVRILRNMMAGAGANFNDYQKAFESVSQNKENLIPLSGLSDKENISIRQASKKEMKTAGKKTEFRNIGDLVRAASGFAFLTCICGMKIKLPPEFKAKSIACPRCKRNIEIPIADMVAVGAAVDAAISSEPAKKAMQKNRLHYKRKGKGWETCKCSCGNRLQISPMFAGTHMQCPKCHSVLEIE